MGHAQQSRHPFLYPGMVELMAHFDRWDVCEAHYMFDVLWGPTEYGQRLRKIGYKPSCLSRLESMSDNAKEIYGHLVKDHNRIYVAFERYARRAPNAPSWPGTNNMPHGTIVWLESQGILDAVLSMV